MDNDKIAEKIAKDLVAKPNFEKAMKNLSKDVLDAVPDMMMGEDDDIDPIDNVLYLIKRKDEGALADTLEINMDDSRSKYGIRSRDDIKDFAKYLIENYRR
jgi:hypothetical protein